MLAYNHKCLDDTFVRDQSATACHNNFITEGEHAAINQVYTDHFYTPNFFIRIGLFILTSIIVLMALGFFFLVFASVIDSEITAGALVIIFSSMLYAALELLIRKRNHFKSGVDDALLWMSLGGFLTGINLLWGNIPNLVQAVLAFLLSGYAALRFSNAVLAALSFLSFLAIIFFVAVQAGDIAKMVMPFLLMAASIFVYWSLKRLERNRRVRHYSRCLTAIGVTTLITTYASVNYMVVRELSNELFGLRLRDGESIPGGWFFWIFTVLLPLVYIVRALQIKDALLLRVGLLLAAATAYTVRYYHPIAPIETTMTAAGIALLFLAWLAIKYLAVPRHGITSSAPVAERGDGLRNLEGLIVAETFHAAPDAGQGQHFDFGGGSGGGGGATGQY